MPVLTERTVTISADLHARLWEAIGATEGFVRFYGPLIERKVGGDMPATLLNLRLALAKVDAAYRDGLER